MRLHGGDRLMILNLEDHTASHLPNVHRVIDNGINNVFVAKMWNPKKRLYENRRFDKACMHIQSKKIRNGNQTQ